MTALTVTAKGQITLRRGLLQHLGIAPGQQLEVDKLAGGVLALHVKTQRGLESFVGCLRGDEINTLSRQSWAQEL